MSLITSLSLGLQSRDSKNSIFYIYNIYINIYIKLATLDNESDFEMTKVTSDFSDAKKIEK